MITQNSCMKYLVGSVSVLAIALAVGCSQQKKGKTPSEPVAPDLTAAGFDDDDFPAPEPRKDSKPEPVMTAIEDAANKGADALAEEAKKPEATPEQRATLEQTVDVMRNIADTAGKLAESNAETIGAVCSAAAISVLSLGGNIEVEDKGKSWAWLGWGIVGGALIGGGFAANKWGVERINAQLRATMGEAFAYGDLKEARKILLSGDAQKLNVFLTKAGRIRDSSRELQTLLDDALGSKTSGLSVPQKIIGNDGVPRKAARDLLDGKGQWVDDFDEKFAALSGIPKHEVTANSAKIQAAIGPEVGAGGQPLKTTAAVAAINPNMDPAKSIETLVSSNRTKFNRALAGNRVFGGLVAAGAVAAAYGIYRAANNDDSLSLADTPSALNDDQNAALEAAAEGIHVANEGCNEPLPNEDV